MRIVVDRARCGQHGQCVIAAPELFSFSDDDRLVYVAEPGEDLRALAEDAMDVCPNRAITIVDDADGGEEATA